MGALLGCIADDFTGGTDLAGMLVKSGLRTVQMIGVPTEPLPDDIDAVVIALKSRTAPVAEAISESLATCKRVAAASSISNVAPLLTPRRAATSARSPRR